ncbi:MAG: DUF4082 domain-containing protein [Micrococcales bacterium]|nr:DUF4082 domain-containing protein [Micrococcales bacterium]
MSSTPKSRPWTRRIVGTLASMALLVGILPATVAHAADPCTTANAVACENTKTGTTDWEISYPSDNLTGFATQSSVNVGQTVQFKVDTTFSAFTMKIYRLGWYGGAGGRLMTTVTPTTARNQPACVTVASTGLIDCGNWSVSASWAVPSTAVSGLYWAVIQNPSTGDENAIPFVVRNDASHSDVVLQTSDTTWQAYNTYGGNSLYSGTAPAGRAYAVSFNRPLADVTALEAPLRTEYPFIRWMERNGYDMSYISGVDADRYGNLLTNHKLFISSGHDEYWSGQQRAKVEAARDAGVNLAFLSGNEVYWKVRYEASVDGSATAYRTLVCYKETHANAVIDPSSEWTGTWMDPRFSPPKDGGRPQNALTGQLFTVNGFREDAIKVPADYSKLRFWRNTSVAALTTGQTKTFANGTLGYEWDEDVDNGFRPAGAIAMSSSTVDLVGQYHLQDYGSTFGDGVATHSLTLYRAASGALVFGAGTAQWSWGLDSYSNDTGTETVSKDIQQATVNVFADMGIQPLTRQSDLVAATKTTDTTAPTATVSAMTGATVGTATTLSGTAVDSGGGRVAGVEVSVDGGTTWKRATGTSSWSLPWTPATSGTASIKVRASDDSANLSAVVTSSVPVAGRACPCTIWPSSTVPANPSIADSSAVEVGLKFRSDQDGFVTGVKFYKGSGNTGTHTGSLWSSTGQRLATGTFTNETASGWQTLTFSSPVAVSAGTTYIASYYAPNGHYAGDTSYFVTKGVELSPLTALQNGVDGGNGVYNGGSSAFPQSTYNGTNYWVDVVFTGSTQPAVSATVPAAGAGSVATDTPITARFNQAVQASSVTFTVTTAAGATVPGTVSYSATTRTATFTPSALLAGATTFTAAARATSAGGDPMPAAYTWSFTTASPQAPEGTCPCSLWPETTTPTNPSAASTAAHELGVRIVPTADGEISGVRFYKGPGNTGTHTGSLWSTSGVQLATATFSNETATGWQTVTFAQPVAVTAGTTYVASYYAPNGGYAYDLSYFATARTYGPLTAPASGSAGNGVYTTGTGFPSSSYQASNYWVDVVFNRSAPVLSASVSPADGASSVATTASVTATFSLPVTTASVQLGVTGPGGTAVPGATTFDTTTRTATFVPTTSFAANTSYTATARATGQDGTGMTPKTWTFRTAAQSTPEGTCPCSLWPETSVPQNPSVDSTQAVELGVKFVPSDDGRVTGVKFYKGSGNTGTHTGSLWSTSGQRLATVTFSGETSSGWQTATFSTPVTVDAGTTYIVSYYAPNGHYAYDSGYFASNGRTYGPLTAPANYPAGGNGVYSIGAGFPGSTYGSTNYWVDVVFERTAVAPTVTAVAPAAGSTTAAVTDPVTATFDRPVDGQSIVFTLARGTTAVTGTTTYDATSHRATFTPSAALSAGTAYTATVTATSASGAPMAQPRTWTFTTAAGQGSCPCSLFADTDAPASAPAGDSSAVEVGVQFVPTTAGQATGVRFYKGAGNTGTHVGSLWSTTGQLLAQVTFTDETASGWQTATFAQPVALTAGTRYVVSYSLPNGHYYADQGVFASAAITRGPLTAPSSGSVGGNGVYRYGSGFPVYTYGAANYWVDVVFTTG